MNDHLAARLMLGYLSLSATLLGIWAVLAPRSFYDSFPGLGRAWVAVDGPYNEHLVRDVGALNLALLVLLVGAAVVLSRPMVTTAAVASVAWGVPHFVYHAFNTEGLSAGDNAASLTGLAIGMVVPVALLWISPRLDVPSTEAAAT